MKHPRLAEDVAPNLVPMVDIMFLLLLFFMLSADMGQRELEAMILPPAVAAVPDGEGRAEIPRLTINGYHRPAPHCDAHFRGKDGLVCREDAHWRIGIGGRDFSEAALALRLEEEAAPWRGTTPGNAKVSERPVMLRVDAAAPCELAQRAMKVCAEAGLYRIEVGAAKALSTNR